MSPNRITLCAWILATTLNRSTEVKCSQVVCIEDSRTRTWCPLNSHRSYNTWLEDSKGQVQHSDSSGPAIRISVARLRNCGVQAFR